MSERPSLVTGGVLRRSIAYVIDSALVLASVVAACFVVHRTTTSSRLVSWITGNPPTEMSYDLLNMWNEVSLAFRVSVVLGILLSQGLLYDVLCHSSGWQASLGKKLAGIRVASLGGGRISFARALWRSLAKALFGIAPAVVGWVAHELDIGSGQTRRGVHDVLAATRVVKGNVKGTAAPLGRLAVMLLLPAALLFVAWALAVHQELAYQGLAP